MSWIDKAGSFLYTYGWIIATVVSFVVWAVYEILTRGLDKFIQAAMLRVQKWAERKADVKGPELMEMVVALTMTYAVSKWPAFLRQIITEEFVRQRAHWLYNTGRDFLDDGKINGSFLGRIGR